MEIKLIDNILKADDFVCAILCGAYAVLVEESEIK